MRFATVNVLHSIVELAELPGPIFLAIGVFDGVHLGHRAVIEHALRAAEAAGGTPVALTPLGVSLEAIFLSILVMIGQNRR